VIGSSHDDEIFAGPGANLIYGGGGNDEIFGANVNDHTTVGYSGARSDYLIAGEGSLVRLVDLRPGSPDGTDTVEGVQAFKFSDGTYSLAQLGMIVETDHSAGRS
jgi:Ca2+-binding RTX toxin-like protein